MRPSGANATEAAPPGRLVATGTSSKPDGRLIAACAEVTPAASEMLAAITAMTLR